MEDILNNFSHARYKKKEDLSIMVFFWLRFGIGLNLKATTEEKKNMASNTRSCFTTTGTPSFPARTVTVFTVVS
jgi:hypothetical protein